MLMTIDVPQQLLAIAQHRGITPEVALQQVFDWGWGDWKTRGKKPSEVQKAQELKTRALALQEQKLRIREQELERQTKHKAMKNKLQAEALQLKLEQRAQKALKVVVRAGLVVMCPDGSKAVLDCPNPAGGKTWLAHREGERAQSMTLPINLMRPIA